MQSLISATHNMSHIFSRSMMNLLHSHSRSLSITNFQYFTWFCSQIYWCEYKYLLIIFQHLTYCRAYKALVFKSIIFVSLKISLSSIMIADSRLAPSQWETSLQSNIVSHWLDPILESALWFDYVWWNVFQDPMLASPEFGSFLSRFIISHSCFIDSLQRKERLTKRGCKLCNTGAFAQYPEYVKHIDSEAHKIVSGCPLHWSYMSIVMSQITSNTLVCSKAYPG